jgi:Notch 1
MTRTHRVALASCLALLSTMVAVREVRAIVLQIDGTIVPASANRIQDGLNKGENGCPDPNNAATCFTNTATPPNTAGAGPKGAIDPIFDGAEEPQVFAIPKDSNNQFKSVEFIDLLEGAGFENTFGWYNVGDDLSNLANLHQVLTCTPTNFEPTPSSNSRLTVNFQTEFNAGRYKGGFIGFFLVTPEGQSGSCATGNCGNPNSANCVGRIYYTEKEINGDGNYVHYLIYQSKVTDATGKRLDDFYFGFEDLYRGGDNDFEDMLMMVRGLVTPCIPSAEICDGLDNNCDGLVDNNTVDTGTSCLTIPGNTGVGECKPGTLVCSSSGPGNTTKTCVGEVGPKAESCNGLDDNCDGQVDNPAGGVWNPPLANACPPEYSVPPCSASTQCIAGVTTCVVAKGPVPEVCNGVDDDCNGSTDDNVSDVGGPCTNAPNDPVGGQCKPGVLSCVNGAPACIGYVGPGSEICDGKDNDCDGEIDETQDLVDVGQQCAPPGAQVCSPGLTICISGTKICTGFTLGSPEICNGIDDDCNGIIDDNLIDTGGPCGSSVGTCEPGVLQCVPATAGDPSTNKLDCVGGVGPGTEVCDGLDNDCDGFVDEDPNNLPGVGDACMSACGDGVLVCDNGKLTCTATGKGTPEICNGIDDDCDGLIDEPEDLTDVGFACFVGGVPLFPPCMPGVTVCVQQGDGSSKIECQDATQGSAEICDGIDNDCDGQIDEGDLPGEGMDCLPPGVTEIKGECKPGKTACVDGKIGCSGGVGPKTEICDGLDNDCDGIADTPDPCPGKTTCVAGQCANPCTKSGEFSTCPGGQFCKDGFCVKPGSGQGGSAGSAGAGGSLAGNSGSGGNSGNSGGSGAESGGNAGDGMAGTTTSGAQSGASGAQQNSSINPDDSNGDGKPDNFGLPTGGGGCTCSVADTNQGHRLWAMMVFAFGMGWWRRRRSIQNSEKEGNQ